MEEASSRGLIAGCRGLGATFPAKPYCAFSDGIIRDRDLSQNIHFFEENSQKQPVFVPQCQNLSWGVKNCQLLSASQASIHPR
jgi:hypothetical protein